MLIGRNAKILRMYYKNINKVLYHQQQPHISNRTLPNFNIGAASEIQDLPKRG